jgi:glutamyl-tRNA synthetase
MAAAFTLGRVSRAPAQFNTEKLEWLNSRYLHEMETDDLLGLVRFELEEAGFESEGLDEDWLLRLVELQKERIRTIREFLEKSEYFFSEDVDIDLENKKVRKVFKKPEAKQRLVELRAALGNVEPWGEDLIEQAIHGYAEENGLKMGDVAQPLRVAVTGGTVSPGIQETLFLIGRDRSLKRIDRALTVV